MSILITGVDIPIGCAAITLQVWPNGEVEIYAEEEWKTSKAVSVPPHGRLIDADCVDRHLLRMQQAQTGPCSHGVRKSRAVLRDAPTVIPAEE